MYRDEYEEKGFPFRDFLLKIILIMFFVFLLIWLLPKFITPKVIEKNTTKNTITDLKSVKAQIFSDNLEKMKKAAVNYYTKERLPQEVGASEKMTLADMIGKKLIRPLIDKDGKACNVDKSYVEITKLDEEYILKVNLKTSTEEDYILVHLGCYSYCTSYVCQKNNATNVSVKAARETSIVYVKSKTKQPTVCKDCNTKNDNKIKIFKCKYDVSSKIYYGKEGNIVSKSQFLDECTSSPENPDPTPDKKICEYDSKTKIYYGINGKKVSKKKFESQCSEPDKDPTSEDKKYCEYDSKTKTYYGIYGEKVSKNIYEKQCKKTPSEEKKYCEYDSNTKTYYGVNGTKVIESVYKEQCTVPEPTPENPIYCEYDSKTKTYYGVNGTKVTKKEYIDQCSEPDPEPTPTPTKKPNYIYEYKKATQAEFSQWSSWSAWEKTSCDTQEVNCSDLSNSCLMKLQRYDRKENIGTYQKAYVKEKEKVVQTVSYQQKTCSNYNYTIINNITYVTTKTTNYTTINNVTPSRQSSSGNWIYQGRAEYSNPPSDTATTRYIFVGANFSQCSDTCTTLPNYYYDKYVFSGKIESVASTTTPLTTTKTTSHTSQNNASSLSVSCGSYQTTTIPVYSTIKAYEKAYRTEPLYGTVCYKSTKTRKMTSSAKTITRWSTYNDQTLLKSGWTYTGKKKEKK